MWHLPNLVLFFTYEDFLSFRVLERLGARALSAHVRVFADYLVHEFSTSVGGKHVNKVWKELVIHCFDGIPKATQPNIM